MALLLTKFFLEGRLTQRDLMGEPVQEVNQISDAKMKLVEIATAHVRDESKGIPSTGWTSTLGTNTSEVPEPGSWAPPSERTAPPLRTRTRSSGH